MSTIFGVRLEDGCLTDTDFLQDMSSAMGHWVPDETFIWTSDQAFFSKFLLRTTPESEQESGLTVTDNLRIVADSRLDNRGEIAVLLGISEIESSLLADDFLILQLYKKFGEDCLRYIHGDFAFVIYNTETKDLFIARDRMGIRPLFYYHDHRRFAFSTEMRGLLSLDFIPKAKDEDFIHCLIARIETAPDKTFFSCIKALLPAHCITIRKGAMHVNRYWTLKMPALLKLSDKQAYVEAFFHEFERAVSVRVRTNMKIGAELSGGLDSSGIVSVAARKIGDIRQLFTYSNVMPRDEFGGKSQADEEGLVDEITQHLGIVNSRKISGSPWRNALEPMDLCLQVNSGVAYFNSWWLEPVRLRMEADGVRVALSGFPGDEAVTTFALSYYHDLLREGYPMAYVREIMRRREYGLPIRQILSRSLPESIVRTMKWNLYQPDSRNSYLTDSVLEKQLVEQYAEKRPRIRLEFKKQLIRRLNRWYLPHRVTSEALFSIPHQLEYRYPMADIRLVEFILSVPSIQFGRKGETRHLFRQAMKGVIPESVRTRQDKSISPMVYYWEESRATVHEVSSWAREVLAAGLENELRLLDKDKLLRGYDPNDPDNYDKGIFQPKRPFELELLARYFSNPHI